MSDYIMKIGRPAAAVSYYGQEMASVHQLCAPMLDRLEQALHYQEYPDMHYPGIANWAAAQLVEASARSRPQAHRRHRQR